MLSDNGNRSANRVFTDIIAELKARHTRVRSGRPQTKRVESVSRGTPAPADVPLMRAVVRP